jgi:hypothetical protein
LIASKNEVNLVFIFICQSSGAFLLFQKDN